MESGQALGVESGRQEAVVGMGMLLDWLLETWRELALGLLVGGHQLVAAASQEMVC